MSALIIAFLIGFTVVFAAMFRWVYRAFMESFHDGILMLAFTVALGVLFIPLSVFGLIIVAYQAITGKEVT